MSGAPEAMRETRPEAIIDRLYAALALEPDDDSWRARYLAEVIPRALDEAGMSPAEIIAWARDHKKWSSTLHETVAEVCAKPPELAVQLVANILAERLDEDR